jgi:hypothetical protein
MSHTYCRFEIAVLLVTSIAATHIRERIVNFYVFWEVLPLFVMHFFVPICVIEFNLPAIYVFIYFCFQLCDKVQMHVHIVDFFLKKCAPRSTMWSRLTVMVWGTKRVW